MSRPLILKVFHVLLYRRLSILQDIYFLCRIRRFVSELIEDACMHTRKSRASKFPSLPKSKNVMNMARHFKKKKEQRNACIFRVSLIKQERLITYSILGFTHWTFLVKITVWDTHRYLQFHLLVVSLWVNDGLFNSIYSGWN